MDAKQIIDKIYKDNVCSYTLRARNLLYWFRNLPTLSKKKESEKDIQTSWEYKQIKKNESLYYLMKNRGGHERLQIMSDLISLSSID